MTQVHGLLKLLWIERMPLAAAPAASIHQGSEAARAIAGQPLVSGAQADAGLRCQISQGLSVLNVSTHKPFPTDSCHSGIRVGMHGL